MSYAGKNYWIIGASSGIGAALARELAARGAKVAASARRTESLQTLVQEMGAGHLALPLDVSNAGDVAKAAHEVRNFFGRIDGVVLMQAVYTPMSFAALDLDEARNIVDINLTGTINCLAAMLPVMREQKSGQIALCGSVAGYRGLPRAQPYAATKAAIINLAESLRLEEEQNGIDVRIINPGFVRTPMTGKNDFKMPMMIEADAAARAIADGLSGSNFEIHFPKAFTFAIKAMRLLPPWLYFKLVRKISAS